MDVYYTTKQLSKKIHMAEGTIRNLVCQGTFQKGIHYIKPTPRKLLFKAVAIDKWLNRNDPPTKSEKKIQNECLINIM